MLPTFSLFLCAAVGASATSPVLLPVLLDSFPSASRSPPTTPHADAAAPQSPLSPVQDQEEQSLLSLLTGIETDPQTRQEVFSPNFESKYLPKLYAASKEEADQSQTAIFDSAAPAEVWTRSMNDLIRRVRKSGLPLSAGFLEKLEAEEKKLQPSVREAKNSQSRMLLLTELMRNIYGKDRVKAHYDGFQTLNVATADRGLSMSEVL